MSMKFQKIVIEKVTDEPEKYFVELRPNFDNFQQDEPVLGDQPLQRVEMDVICTSDIEQAQVFEDLEYAEHMMKIMHKDGVEFIATHYKMRKSEIIFRSLNLIFIYVIVLPLYFAKLCCALPFVIANNFTYGSFKRYTLPDVALQKAGTGFYSPGFLKIWLLLVGPIIEVFVDFYYTCKTIQF